MDWTLILLTRWPIIVSVVIVTVIYLFTMDFRRFLAVVCMNVVFCLMWEGVSLGMSFPGFSLRYVMPWESELFIGTIPTSALFFKGVVYATGSYLVSSMACREFIHSKVDLVKDRGHRINEHMLVGIFASFVYTLAIMVIEPVLANAELFGMGVYEKFLAGTYYGVDPLMFIGTLASSAVSFVAVSVLDANIQQDKPTALFDYDTSVQSPRPYHRFAIVAFWTSVIIPAILSSVISTSLAVIDIVMILPSTAVVIALIWHFSTRKDDSMVRSFCDDHPDSFVCGM
jgi:hypothetical protein